MLTQKIHGLINFCNGFVIKRHKIVLAVFLTLSLPMLYFYTQQRHENHVEIYFDENHPDLLYYHEFQKKYGNEEFIMVVFEKPDIFTQEDIELVRDLTAALKKIDGVSRIWSLTEAEQAYGEDDTVTFSKIIPDDLTDEAIANVKKRALEDQNLVGSIVSKDGTTTAVIAELESFKDEAKRKLVETIIRRMRKIGEGRADLHIAGVPVAEARMNTLSARDYNIFTPLILLIIFAVVAVSLHNWMLSLLTQLNMFLILVWGIGLYCLAGETFNMLTVIIGPMLLTTAVEHSIHVLSEFEKNTVAENGKAGFSERVERTIKQVWAPCFLTSLTTVMGFISFGKASVQPVQTIGIYTSITVMMGFVISMIFLPAILMTLQKRLPAKISAKPTNGSEKESLIMRLLMQLVEFDIRHYRPIAIFTLTLLVAAAAIGIYRLHFETNSIRYLSEKERTRQDVQFIEKNLGGTIPFVITVQAKSPEDDFTHPHSLEILDTIQNNLIKMSQGHYTISFSIANYFKEINRAFNDNDQRFFSIPQSQSDILDFYEIGDGEVLERIIAPDRMEARISFQTIWGSTEEAVRRQERNTAYLNRELGDSYTWKVTGISTLYLTMEHNLINTQISSFLLSLLMISIMMLFVCRSTSLAIISLAPNLFPIFLTLGVMGVFNIPFDVATIMIGSVTLGIVVDDTTHYMIWFRRNMMKNLNHRDAIVQTFRDVGKPTFLVSLVLCLGFGVLTLGSIKPTQYFGLLSAFAMFIAPFGDYFMLPALILIFKPKVKR